MRDEMVQLVAVEGVLHRSRGFARVGYGQTNLKCRKVLIGSEVGSKSDGIHLGAFSVLLLQSRATPTRSMRCSGRSVKGAGN